MAIVMIISIDTANEPDSYEDDIVSVFPDGWNFTQHELDMFEFLTINGSVEDVELRLEQIKPVIGVAHLKADGKYTFDVSLGTGEEIEVWTNMKSPINWYKYVVPFNQFANFGPLTAEEKQLLATIDIMHPSVDATIKKIVKDLSVIPANNVEVKELKGEIFS